MEVNYACKSLGFVTALSRQQRRGVKSNISRLHLQTWLEDPNSRVTGKISERSDMMRAPTVYNTWRSFYSIGQIYGAVLGKCGHPWAELCWMRPTIKNSIPFDMAIEVMLSCRGQQGQVSGCGLRVCASQQEDPGADDSLGQGVGWLLVRR